MQKSEVETDILDVSEYLSLKLLGRDARVKLSDVFDATKWAGSSSLLAVSNKLGWFVAGTPTGLVASPLTHLRETQASSKGDGPVPIEPKHCISLSGAPYFVHFANSHSKIVVVVRTDDTWNLEVFSAEDICRESVGDVKPTHTLSLGGEDVIDIQPNPSEGSKVVAILRGRQSSSSRLDMINVSTASRITSWGAANSSDESTALTSMSWSVRGKQIVVGTRNGELVQFTPEGERKQTIPPPPSLSSPQSVVSVLWLENTVFHVVYGNPNSDPSNPTHDYEVYNILFDSKANSANYVKFIDPAPPYGLLSRLSCRHYARLVGWEPAKHLIFVADGPSTDVGAIACLNSSEIEGKPSPWVTLEVDETSRISLPMDDEMNETSIVGFDLDLTSTDPISNSQEAGDGAAPSPPSPILHLYTSAGLVISYHVLNSRGDKYPGMGMAEVPSVVGATPAKALPDTTPVGAPAFGVSAFGTSATPAKPNAFQSSTTPATAPAFGQASAPGFGQTSAFGTTSAFGSKPAFGSSTFGGNSGGGFGKFTSATPASAPSGGGFAGFGSNPTTFGSSAPTTNIFGSASGNTTPKTESPLSAFGSSAFGGTGATTPKSAFGGFGSSTPSVASPVKPRDESADPDSPPTTTNPPIEMSPPGSPGAQSDSGIDVGDLDITSIEKKPPAGLDASDDESDHDPIETPSKPPASTSGFAGFGKPSAFGTAASSGAFTVKPATGAFGSTTGATFGSTKMASGFGAFGNKAAAPSTGFGFGGGDAKKDEKPAFAGGSGFGSSAFGSSGSSTPTFGSSAFGSSTSGTSTPAFGSTSAFGTGASSAPAFGATSKPGSAFGAAPTFGTTSAPAFGATSAFGAQPKPTESSAPAAGGFSAFAASKPGESKVTGGGFAGFGDATKNKGGFVGFGDGAKKNIFAESVKPEEKKDESTQEPAPKNTEETKAEIKPEPPKSAFGNLLVSSPPPKPKAPSPAPEASKPASETPSKIPVPTSSLLDRLSPRPEPQEPAEPEPPKSESSTPPGSPVPSASPPPAPPKSAPPPTPSPFSAGKLAPKPFGSTPLRSSPLASPPVNREQEILPSSQAPIKPPALTPKTSSENVNKPAGTGFFGFGKPAATEEKKESTAVTGTSGPATMAAPSAKPPSLFSGPAAVSSPFSAPKPPTSTSPAPAPALAASFAKPASFAAPAASSPASSPFSGFGVKSGASPFSAPSSSPPSLFGQPPAPKTPPATSTPPPASSFGFASFKPATSTPPPASESSPSRPAVSNVEAEFNRLLVQMSAELGKLRQDTVMLQQYHAQVSRANIPAAMTVQKLDEPAKWGLGDSAALKRVAGLVSKEVDRVKGLNKDFVAQMTELQPSIEKVQAKRNEIARYLKAKKDPKYTRLLKSRTSSPEHIESQTKLRKSLQIVRERTRQLEDFMATQRSRIQKQKEGRREFKVPSIDTINRTMRNIDSALAQKTDEIVALTARVDRMKIKAPRRKASTNTAPLTIPPAENEKIKLASATALNMERSSLRLKNALLQTRTETPLNTTAVGALVEEKPNALARVMPSKSPVPTTPAAPTVPIVPSTPAPSFPVFAQPPGTPNPFAPKPPTPAQPPAPSGGFSFTPITPAALPSFTPLGNDSFHVTAGYEHSGRRSEKSRMHGSSVKLKTPSPNISRTTSDAPTISPLPAPTLTPSITPAKSFFGSSPAASTGRKTTAVPDGFFSFAAPSGGPVASTPPPPPKGFSFFQTPAQKAAVVPSTTPVIPPVPSWGTPNSSMSSTASRVKDDEEEDAEGDDSEGSEDHSGEDDEEWVHEDEDEVDEDEDEDVSDGVPEGVEDDEDQTARV
ncbi:hypothetical protein V565_117840 [Rhizoctonia solani 123E]|uniref:Nucleoporin Nup159/Nup146 N-terminal domain-containing protein n=1 Tax=Rhizoctonia solani 123E TaxID=1423351 RepID=A0A074RPB0_9AGAM|nr:hypothetical protein V565_117840 [Rhizoctonia solani 123E]